MHLQFNASGKAIILHDLQSEFGTFLDDKPVQEMKLQPSSRKHQLKVGNTVLVLTHNRVSQSAPPAMPAEKRVLWFYESDGIEQGPLPESSMIQAAHDGELKPTDDVWTSVDPQRRKASDFSRWFAVAEESGKLLSRIAAERPQDKITCPYCWNRFAPEDVLFIAGHPDLMGDPILGKDEQQRFLPSRFTPEGLAIDAHGVACPDMACPHCHVRIPQTLLTAPPLFVSLVGAPSSGKSYFLASLSWKLRSTLPNAFSVRFLDVDAITNQWVNEYEQTLFLQANDQSRQSIVKTDQQAPHVYRQIMLNNMQTVVPLPCMFAMRPDEGSIYHEQSDHMFSESLILYDNAGEHFQPGEDSASNPGTQHLLRATGLIFLFDPTEDARFRPLIRLPEEADMQVQRQDMLLVEMISRIRKYLGLKEGQRFKQPIVLAISKADVMKDSLYTDDDPWFWDDTIKSHSLDLNTLANVSFKTRSLLEQYAPEVVATIESFADHVMYLPNSALGHNPSQEGIRPCDVKPRWVEAPLLYILARQNYIPSQKRSCDDSATVDQYEICGRMIHVTVPGTDQHVKVPGEYAGYDVTCPKTGVMFRVPDGITSSATE